MEHHVTLPKTLMGENDEHELVRMCHNYDIELLAKILEREYEDQDVAVSVKHREMNFDVQGKCVSGCSWERFGKLADKCWICGNSKVRKSRK
jgi:hypothetical protein